MIIITKIIITIIIKKKKNELTSSKPGPKFSPFFESTNTTGAAMASCRLMPSQRWFIRDWMMGESWERGSGECVDAEMAYVCKLSGLRRPYQGYRCSDHAASGAPDG